MRIIGTLTLALLLVACGETDEPNKSTASGHANAVSDLAALVPADADVVVKVSSLDALERVVRDLAVLSEKPVPAGMVTQLALMAGVDLAQVDRSKPMAVSVSLDPNQPVPVPTFVLPVQTGVVIQGMVAEQGDYVAVTRAPGYRRGSALVADMPAGDVVVRVDLVSVLAKYKEQVDGLVGMAQGFRGMPMPAAVTGIMGDVLTRLQSVVDSAESLDLVLRRGERDLALDFAYVARADSVLASGEVVPSGLRDLCAALPRDYPITLAMNFDVGVVAQMLTSALPVAQLEALKAHLSNLGDEWVVGADLAADGLKLVAAGRAQDTARVLRGLASAPDVTSTVIEVEGVQVHRLEVKVHPPKDEAAKFRALFGGDVAVIHMAAVGDRIVASMGEDVAQVVRTASVPAGVADARVEGELRFLCRIATRPLFEGVRALSMKTGEAVPNPLPASAPDIVTFFGARDGRVYRAGVVVTLPETKSAAAGD